MHLNHINLCTSDVAALAHALEVHFGYRMAESGTVPDVPWVTDPGSSYAILIGEDGSNLVLTQIEPVPEGRSAYPPQFHIGVMQETADAVHAKRAELLAAGYAPGEVAAGFEVLGATWTTFYCPLGDGLEIEVNHRTRSELLDA